jgi:putative permease
MSDRGTDLYKALAKAIYLATGLFVFLWFLYAIDAVLLAALLALIFAVAINAPVTWLENRGWSRGAGTAVAFIAFLGILVLIGWLMIPRLADEIPQLIDQLPDLMETMAAQITAVVGDQPELRQQLSRIVDWTLGVVEGVWRYADVMATAAVFGLFMLAMGLYMVLNLSALLGWYVRSMPPRLRGAATRAFAQASQMVIGWVMASVIIGIIKAVAALVFLTAMGVPGALIWSFLAFFGAFVPRVGFYVMTVPPVIVAFSVSPMTAVWTLIFYVVFAELLGNFVAPRIFAETMKLNAVFILFMTLAMGYAFGVIGVLIAAPVAGILKAYYDEFYLAQHPDAPDLDERVRVMMTRDTAWRPPEGETSRATPATGA